MKIKLFLLFCLCNISLYAWEESFSLSQEAQKKADFYGQFITAVTLENQSKPKEA